MPKKVKKTKSASKSAPKHGFNKVIKIIIILALLIGAAYFAYSVYVYQNSEEEHVGFFVCNKENTICELSQHIHADIHMDVCGETIIFAKEKGRTDRQHTHKETNKIHWHARLKVHPQTRKPLDMRAMSIRSFLDQMEYVFPTKCQNNIQPQMIVQINEKVQDGLDVNWVDGDTIKITYN